MEKTKSNNERSKKKWSLKKVSAWVTILVGIMTILKIFIGEPFFPRKGVVFSTEDSTSKNLQVPGNSISKSVASTEIAFNNQILVVSPFENITTTRLDIGVRMSNADQQHIIERYSEVGRELLEDIMVDVPGVKVVSRRDLQAIMEELNLHQSGLVTRSTALELGKLLGANGIVLGSLMSLNEESFSKKLYGNDIKTTTVKASIRVRLINVESGQISISEIVDGTIVFNELRPGASKEDQTIYDVIRDALDQLRDNRSFVNAFR